MVREQLIGKPSPGVSLAHQGKMWFFEFSHEMRSIQNTLSEVADSIPDSPSKAERKLYSIIQRYPYSFDAYNQLAYIYSYGQQNLKQARDILEEGLAKFKELIPKNFVFGRSNLPWAVLENRPFLRMYKSIGINLKESGKTETAREVFQNIVAMNPDDNQGMRELLCSCCFQLGKNESVLDLCRKYKGDGMAAITFGRVLALFKVGRVNEAKKALREATRYGANITREIIADTHRKLKDKFSPYEWGSKREAELYWDEFGSYWDAAAVKFVREEAQTNSWMRCILQKEVGSREDEDSSCFEE
jgi:tetratricopeptide (TPR) repeat protein